MGNTAPVSAQDFVMVTKGKLVRHSNRALSSSQKSGLNFFVQGQQFFGAIYMNTNGKGFNWFRNLHSLRAAKLSAQQHCQADARKTGGQCYLYATLQPVGSSRLFGDPITMSQGMTRFIAQSKARYWNSDGFVAAAASDNGSWGISKFRRTEKKARKDAMRKCTVGAVESRLRADRRVAKRLAAQGFYECKIFLVSD